MIKVTYLKNLLKEINEPNEYVLSPFDLNHPTYWIFKKDGIRLKTLNPTFEPLRSNDGRYDVFINGLFIARRDYILEHENNDIYIKFKRSNFPTFDRFGGKYEIEESDEVKIKGDIEEIR